MNYIEEHIWKNKFKNILCKEFEHNLPIIYENIIDNALSIELGLARGDIGIVHWENEYKVIRKLNKYVEE